MIDARRLLDHDFFLCGNFYFMGLHLIVERKLCDFLVTYVVVIWRIVLEDGSVGGNYLELVVSVLWVELL